MAELGLSRFRLDWVLVHELALGPAPRAERHLDRLSEAGVTNRNRSK